MCNFVLNMCITILKGNTVFPIYSKIYVFCIFEKKHMLKIRWRIQSSRSNNTQLLRCHVIVIPRISVGWWLQHHTIFFILVILVKWCLIRIISEISLGFFTRLSCDFMQVKLDVELIPCGTPAGHMWPTSPKKISAVPRECGLLLWEQRSERPNMPGWNRSKGWD